LATSISAAHNTLVKILRSEMNKKRWQNIALGLAFAVPVIGVYIGKRLLSKKPKKDGRVVPEVTRIRIPITSLIGLYDNETASQTEPSRIVLPKDDGDKQNGEYKQKSEIVKIRYVASEEGEKFHLPECRWAQNINPDNRLEFADRSQAINHGYAPCNTCNP
jgi:hypothetical protein